MSRFEKRHGGGGNVININKVEKERQIASVVNAIEICSKFGAKRLKCNMQILAYFQKLYCSIPFFCWSAKTDIIKNSQTYENVSVQQNIQR